jgi:hypothetical protein
MALTLTEPEGEETYPFYRSFTTDGIGGGSIDGIGDFSVTPRVLKVNCRAGERLLCGVLLVHVQDAGVLDPAKYGALAALTNGIIIGIHDADGVETMRITQDPILHFGDWQHIGRTTQYAAAAGDVSIQCQIAAGGVLGNFKLYPGMSYRVTLNDNLTGLTAHDFILCGTRVPA